MAKNTPPDEPAEVYATIPLGEWMTQMMERDNQMWEKLNSRDDKVMGEVLKLVSQVLDANSIDHVVFRGIDEASKQLKDYMGPMRSLGREYGDPRTGAPVAELRAEIATTPAQRPPSEAAEKEQRADLAPTEGQLRHDGVRKR